MKGKLTLYRKAALWLAVPLLSQVALFVWYCNLARQIELAEQRQYLSRHFVAQTNWVLTLIGFEAFGLFAYRNTHDQDFLEFQQASATKSKGELKELSELANSLPVQTLGFGENTQKLLGIIDKLSKDPSLSGNVIQPEEREQVIALKQAWRQVLSDRHRLLREDKESFRDAGIDSVLHNCKKNQTVLYIALTANMALTMALLLGFSRHVAKRLAVVNDNAARLANSRSLQQPLPGNDEVSEVDLAFHQMADALEEARQRESALIDNAVDVICSVDEAGLISAISPSSISAWGYQPSELIGRSFISVVHESDRERTAKAFEFTVGQKSPLNLETQITHANGTVLDIHCTGCWSESRKSLYCVARDVSDRRRLEEFKRQFVAMISHDLRAPLTNIGCSLDLVMDRRFGAPPKLVKLAEGSKQNVNQLIGMVNDLLEVEKFESDSTVLHMQQFNLALVLEEALNGVNQFAVARGITIRVQSIDASSDASVFADCDRLRQVMINLLSNAIKFSDDGSSVSVVVDAEPNSIKVVVEDEGCGIPIEQQGRIFERFYQAATRHAKRGSGTGLGLTICKTYIEAHRGTIGFNSEPGVGSKFWFEIPRNSIEPIQVPRAFPVLSQITVASSI